MANAAAKEKTQEASVFSAIKLKIERGALLKALSHVQSVVERRGTIPILANVRLSARNGQLELAATDMDIAVEDRVAAAINSEGATTVPAHTFYDIVRKLPEGSEVELKKEGEAKLAIRCAGSRFSLSTLPAEDFPVMAEGDLSHHFSLNASDCIAMIEKTRFAVSTEETRYYLNGIYLHSTEKDGVKVMRAVATDGHRLARIELPMPEGAAGMPGIIIPRKTIGELRKLLESGVEKVDISLSATKIRFRAGDATLTSKLIDGTFPDYERVIPQANNKIMEVDGKAFAAAVDRVSVISSEKSRGIKFALAPGKLTLSASSAEQGTASEELEVTYAADAMESGFNSRYLLDMMAQIEGDVVQFVLAEATAPALVRDPGDVGALYVIMPMRV